VAIVHRKIRMSYLDESKAFCLMDVFGSRRQVNKAEVCPQRITPVTVLGVRP